MLLEIVLLSAFLALPALAAQDPGDTPGPEVSGAPTACLFEAADQPFDASLEKARSAHRLVLLEVHAPGCAGSARLAAETYADPGVAAMLRERFVNVRADSGGEEGAYLSRLYKARTSPFIVFTDAAGEAIDWVAGFVPAPELMARLQAVSEDRDTFRSFQLRYEADPGDVEAGLRYASKLMERGDQKEVEAAYGVIENVLEAARREKRPEAGACLLLLYPKALADGDVDKAAVLLEELVAEFPGMSGAEGAYLLLSQIYAERDEDLDKAEALLRKAAEHYAGAGGVNAIRFRLAEYLDTAGDYEGALAELALIEGEAWVAAINQRKAAVLIKQGREAEAAELCRRWHAACAGDPEGVNAVAWACHENGILLEEAVEWARRMVEADGGRTAGYIDTYAWLLYDTGEAGKAAELEEQILFAAEDDKDIEQFGTALKVFRKAVEEARRDIEGE